MLLSTEFGAIAADEAARASLNIARRRNYNVPETIRDAEGVVTAVEELAAAQTQPTPSLPDAAKDVAKAVTTAATARATAEHVRLLAEELTPVAVQRVATLSRNACPNWIAELRETFGHYLKALRLAAPAAPRVSQGELGDLSPSAFAAWSVVNTAALELDACVADRITLAAAIRENFATRNYSGLPPYVVAHPPHGTDRANLETQFQARNDLFRAASTERDAVTKWRALVDAEAAGWVTLDLARPGEAGARIELLNTWAAMGSALQQTVGLEAHMAHADSTYRQLTPARAGG